jgi:hypothetical protein
MSEILKIQNMQPHVRIVIRNRVKELLKENTDLGGKWFCSRPKSIFQQEVPCGLIYFQDEISDFGNITPRNYKRTITLLTEVVHQLETDRENAVDDFLDSRAFEIEASMMYDRFLGLPGIVEDCLLMRTEPTNISMEGSIDIATLRIHWNVIYRTDAFYEGEIDEFLKYTADYNLVDGAEAMDNVTIREN